MSFDRTDPDHCPTCDTTEPCVHRATRSAHVAYREGRDAFNIPWSNRTPIAEIDRTCMYPEGTDDASWWHRGFQNEARHAVALEHRATVIELCKRVGTLLGDACVGDGSHVVETQSKENAALWRQYGVRGGVLCVRVHVVGEYNGWGDWQSSLCLCPGDFSAIGRCVPEAQSESPPTARGALR